uniref:uncharacterized protein LOC120330115 isoform X1 n=2 Tax=Styela clava TaxID=7725 RepID=UPI0019392F18|nr:uncharacterized protein LOC120330115 isoform X1 [Styela clava]XP_039252883.1 uncharacterized protein LOC120330115 isoform X1 [Styela clava]
MRLNFLIYVLVVLKSAILSIMMNFQIFSMLIFVQVLIQNSTACPRRKSRNEPTGGDDDSSNSDVATMSPPPEVFFNCNFSDVKSMKLQAAVYNLTNATDLLCNANIDMTDLLNATVSRENRTRMCNYLGGMFCANCSIDSSHHVNVANVSISCINDAQTTSLPTTTIITTNKETTSKSTTQMATETNFMLDTTTINDRKVLGTKEIAIIGGITGLVCLLLIILLVVLLCRKRRADIDKDSKESVMHVEAEETGELYTVVKKTKTKSQIKENVLYEANSEPDTVGDIELYAIVDKKGPKKDVSETNITGNILYDGNTDAQPGEGDLYTVVDKKNKKNNSDKTTSAGTGGDVYSVVDKKKN